MEWIKCLKCGHDEFKISTIGAVHCAECSTKLGMEIRSVDRKEPHLPRPPEPSPKFPSHPDIQSPHMF